MSRAVAGAIGAAVAIRLVAAAALLAGPWTDDPADLQGWDAARFQEIHDAPGRPWVDHEVEYPPGSVILIETGAADDVVGTNRRLVVAGLAVDLTAAGLLAGSRRPSAAAVYLLLGLPLVPAGLLRFDLWAALATTVGLLCLARPTTDGRRGNRVSPPGRVPGPPGWPTAVAFGAATTLGAAVKIAPALLILAAMALGRRRPLGVALGAGFVAVGGWIAYGGIDAIQQVASLRGVTGWHIESVPGSLLALTGSGDLRFEADAYRIGVLHESVVMAGRLLFVATAATLTVLGRRARRPGTDALDVGALVVLGSTAALIVTAPLLSPQFLLWLTPAAALAWPTANRANRPARRAVVLTGTAIAVTAATLGLFGPPGLDHPGAAAALLVRDGALVAVVVNSARALLGFRPNGIPGPG